MPAFVYEIWDYEINYIELLLYSFLFILIQSDWFITIQATQMVALVPILRDLQFRGICAGVPENQVLAENPDLFHIFCYYSV